MLDQAQDLSQQKVIPSPYQIVALIHDGIPHRDAAHSCLVLSAVADFASVNHISGAIGAGKAFLRQVCRHTKSPTQQWKGEGAS